MPPRSLALALVAATLVAYLPALGAGYVWDDDKYLTGNPLLGSLDGLLRIWVPGNTPQYYPAVFTTFWLEHALWGLEPAGYHVVNVLLHALNAVLVWRLAHVLGLPGAGFIAAAFALHPVHVESVAWVTERKNVLSGLLYLLAALAYLRFDARRDDPGQAGRAWRGNYAFALVAFVLALLAKTVTCSLPAALILMHAWQRRPLTWRRLAPLVPMFAIGVLLALNTVHLERTHVGARGTDFDFTLGERLLIASNALLFYPQKLLVPWPLMFTYPRWQLEASEVTSFWPLAVVVVVAIAAAVAFARGVRGPGLALAFFAGSVFPALGFIDVYPMRYSFVADHFQYLASLGVLALVAAVGTRLVRTARARRVGAAAALVALGALTWRQTLNYADEETLWRETLKSNPHAWIAHTNLSWAASRRGDHAAALARLRDALPLADSPLATYDIRRGIALQLSLLGRDRDALAAYDELHTEHGGLAFQLAVTLEAVGRDDDAEARFREAIADDRAENLDAARVSFAKHLLRRRRPAEAVPQLEPVVAAHPEDPNAALLLADALSGSDRPADALAVLEHALVTTRANGGDDRLIRELERRSTRLRRRNPANTNPGRR